MRARDFRGNRRGADSNERYARKETSDGGELGRVRGFAGRIGTMEELFEVITWQQLGYHKKPIGVLNVNGYFDSLLTFLDEARESGFVSEEARNIVLSDDDAERLIGKMRAVHSAERGDRARISRVIYVMLC